MKYLSNILVILGLLSAIKGVSQVDNLESSLDNYISPLLQMNAWSGVIGVYKNGAPILEKGYGLADREWNIKNAINGKFRIASVSKVFTEVAIFKLIEKGQLNLEDKLSSFIPDYPRGDEISIKNLLNHTSGIPHLNSYPNYNELIKNDYSIVELIELFKHKTLDFNPGDKYNYSNSAYVLLAYIIEVISKKKYGDYLEEVILDPLEMRNTGIDNSSTLIPNRVRGYMFNSEAALINAEYINMDIKIGGGSLYSTLGDLKTFTLALVKQKMLSKKSLDELPNIQGKGAEKIFSANGRVQGFCHQITHKYSEDLTIIVLGNNYSNIALPIADAIYEIYHQRPPEPQINYLNQQKVIKEKDLQKYVGVYDFGFGPIGEVEIRDGKLIYGNPNKTQRDVLIPIGSHQFFYLQSWVILEFADREQESFKTLNWVMGKNKYPATKLKEK